ncbi:poly [ADP-ribose] polymerase tankyrase-1-like [Impatiens glandulifera]|uniref:poly [ADP-ribose] polymerase tankyrase-1-like n=1 Tax=Impatiens glandulifera TaxID=253017 RepID=UPI001FB19B6B|nr:poly [ADP-ribose] polymerase tankyrase-1-like [Impatiens glandulifera]
MSISDRQNYLFIDYNSGDESSSNSTSDDSSSDEEDSIFLGDVDEFMAEVESKIHPHFREIAVSIKKDDVFGLSVALDNFNGNIDEDLIDGETALHYACQYYRRSCFELLLQRNANIEATNRVGSIPLHIACRLGSFRMVQTILNSTTNRDIINRMVQSVNMMGETPLHEAVVGIDINVIKLLFNVGASSNINGINKMLKSVDIFGKTPLHQAAIYGNARVVKLLLECGACPDITNYDGKIPWDLAKPNSNIRRVLEDDED